MTDAGSSASLGRSPVPARVAELFDEAATVVFRTAWRITGSREDAQDVLQQVFLQILQSIPPAPWPDNPIGFARRAATNVSLDVLRRRVRWVMSPLADHEGLAARLETPISEHIDAERLKGRLRAALTELSPLEAEVFSLRAFEDLSNGEIATLLDKTPGHVGVTLHSARQKLKELLSAPSSGLESRSASEGDLS